MIIWAAQQARDLAAQRGERSRLACRDLVPVGGEVDIQIRDDRRR
jgi:hypothetical protein